MGKHTRVGMLAALVCISGIAFGQSRDCPTLQLGIRNDENFKSCLARAEAGDVNAQVILGDMYWLGLGTGAGREPEKAKFWHRRAADAGNAEAQYRTGVYAGVASNTGESLKWLEKAAIQGHEEAFKHARQGMSLARARDPAYAPKFIAFLESVAARSSSQQMRAEAKTLLTKVATEFNCSEYAKAGPPEDPQVEFQGAMKLGCIQQIWGAIIIVNEVKRDPARAASMWTQFWDKYLAPPNDKSGGRAVSLLKAAADRRIPSAMAQLSDVYAKGLYGERVDEQASALWRSRANEPVRR
jgi:TPR repeat protein